MAFFALEGTLANPYWTIDLCTVPLPLPPSMGRHMDAPRWIGHLKASSDLGMLHLELPFRLDGQRDGFS